MANFDIDATPGPPVSFQTSALTVQNLGRRAAGDVQIILSGQPADLQMYPIIPHEEHVTEDGHFVLTIPRLAPQEIVTLQIVGSTTFRLSSTSVPTRELRKTFRSSPHSFVARRSPTSKVDDVRSDNAAARLPTSRPRNHAQGGVGARRT